ncbi:MAG: MFS transporter [Methylococcaceae bacterium]|nr:MFS transporter [Methylococcaceae bacterium]
MAITDPTDSAAAEPLSRRTMMLYALPHLTDAVMTLPMALFIPAFYAGEMGLPLAGVGAMISVSRIFDVLTDPVIGTLSDRWHSPWGRRKPWLVVGTPIIMLATWMLFVPPAGASLIYLMIWASLLSIGYSIFDLPYKAWGAELSTGYRERSRIAAWREGFGAAGQFLFLAVLIAMGLAAHQRGSDEMRAIALMVAVSLPPLVAVMLWKVPERPPEKLTGEVLIGWTAMISLFKNRAFLRTVLAIILFGAGLMIQATLHKLVLTHVIGRPELFAPLILGETVASLIAMPLWLKLSDHIGKHRAVTLASLWVGFWSLPLPWVGAGDIEWYAVLIGLRGSSFAAIFFLSNSIAADVIDQDTLDTGKQRTGLFFALWGMAIKLAVALGVLMGTGFPALFGFVPTATSHSPASISALMHIYGWLPGLIMLLAFPLLWNFPIDEAYHRQLRARIEARRSP